MPLAEPGERGRVPGGRVGAAQHPEGRASLSFPRSDACLPIPAKFTLVNANARCPCGFYGDPNTASRSSAGARSGEHEGPALPGLIGHAERRQICQIPQPHDFEKCPRRHE